MKILKKEKGMINLSQSLYFGKKYFFKYLLKLKFIKAYEAYRFRKYHPIHAPDNLIKYFLVKYCGFKKGDFVK